jgi:hypothetical protein
MIGAAAAAARAGAAICVALSVLAGCVSPAIDEHGFRGKVTHSADELFGIVGAARLAVRLDMHGRMIANLTDAIVTSAETDGQSVLTAFESVQPPDPAMVRLRQRADTVLQRAAGDLSDLRIAVRSGDRAGQRQALQTLGGDLRDLSSLETGV